MPVEDSCLETNKTACTDLSGTCIREGVTDLVHSLKLTTTAQPCSLPVGYRKWENLPLWLYIRAKALLRSKEEGGEFNWHSRTDEAQLCEAAVIEKSKIIPSAAAS